MIEAVRKSIARPLWMKWELGFGPLARLRSSFTAQYGICKVMVKQYRGKTLL